jgi:hypothetical protein
MTNGNIDLTKFNKVKYIKLIDKRAKLDKEEHEARIPFKQHDGSLILAWDVKKLVVIEKKKKALAGDMVKFWQDCLR